MTFTERMMQTEQLDKLIERLRECSTYGFKQEICGEAADALTKIADDYANLYVDNDANLDDLNPVKADRDRWRQCAETLNAYIDDQERIKVCTGCTFEHSDRDDYPCTVCRRNPALTDKYEVNSNG